MTEHKLQAYFASLQNEATGDELVAICQYMLAHGTSSESDILSHFRYTRGQYTPKFAAICQRLITFLVADRDGFRTRHALQFASDLADAGDVEGSIDIIRSTLRQAAQVEDLELMVGLCDILSRFHESFIPDSIDQIDIRAKHRNLSTYTHLFFQLRRVAQTMNPVASRQAIQVTLAEPVMAGPEQALTKKALFFYWQTYALIHSVRRNHQEAITCLETTLTILRDHPWIDKDPEYAIAKQMKLLAEQYRVTGQIEKYHQIRTDLDATTLNSFAAQQERIYLRFPFDIFASNCISADAVATIANCRDFLQLLRKGGHSYPATFVTENLYLCLHAAVTIKSAGLWEDVASLLSQFPKTDFRLLFYPMYRFLEVIHAIDIEDWDEAYRLAKNLRKSDATKSVQGMNEALAYLLPPVYAKLMSASASFEGMLSAGWDSARVAILGSALCEYFDLTVWYEATASGCPMIEIFKNRAAS